MAHELPGTGMQCLSRALTPRKEPQIIRTELFCHSGSPCLSLDSSLCGRKSSLFPIVLDPDTRQKNMQFVIVHQSLNILLIYQWRNKSYSSSTILAWLFLQWFLRRGNNLSPRRNPDKVYSRLRESCSKFFALKPSETTDKILRTTSPDRHWDCRKCSRVLRRYPRVFSKQEAGLCLAQYSGSHKSFPPAINCHFRTGGKKNRLNRAHQF